MFPTIDAGVMAAYGPTIAALLVLIVVGKVLKSESRVYQSALIAVIVHPYPETILLMVVLHLSLKLFDILKP
jgi:hypothetical protein